MFTIFLYECMRIEKSQTALLIFLIMRITVPSSLRQLLACLGLQRWYDGEPVQFQDRLRPVVQEHLRVCVIFPRLQNHLDLSRLSLLLLLQLGIYKDLL